MDGSNNRNTVSFDLDALLHPAAAYGHPRDVLQDPDLTISEKRAVLSSWASDACAVEANPALRECANGRPVPWDDIIDALRELDWQEGQMPKLARRRLRWRRGGGSRSGPAPEMPHIF